MLIRIVLAAGATFCSLAQAAGPAPIITAPLPTAPLPTLPSAPAPTAPLSATPEITPPPTATPEGETSAPAPAASEPILPEIIPPAPATSAPGAPETATPTTAPAAPTTPVSTAPETSTNEEAESTLEAPSISKLKLSGYLKNETAFRYNVPRTITKIRNIAYLKGVYSYSERSKITFAGWIYHDLAYDLFNYDRIVARQQRNGDQPLAFLFNLGREADRQGAELRELYWDLSFDKMDVRLGRQFVVWGLLEGIRIVDVINPIDFRELIMPDLLDYRIPLWTAKIDYYRKEGTYQFLWIPDVRADKPGPPGSEWELLQNVPGTVHPKEFDPRNSDAGARLSTRLWDTDLTFSYFYTYDEFPTIFRKILINQVQATPEFHGRYTRESFYGSTLNKQIGDYLLKGEIAYVTGKYFAIQNVDRDHDGYLDSQGEQKHDHIRWGLGLEFNWKGMDITPGVTQWIIRNYDTAMVLQNNDTSLNLFLRKEFPQTSTLFELLAISFINEHELYVNPKVTFLVTDRFKITTGLNTFYGQKSQFGVLANPNGAPTVIDQRSQFVGNFHDNNRIYCNFKYSF